MALDPADASPLLTERLEAPLAPLDALPRGLWLNTLAHSQGTLEPRLAEVERWRAALLAGSFPPPQAWPHPSLAQGIAGTLRAIDLARHCAGDEAVADQVLNSLLWHLDRIAGLVDRGATPTEAEVRALEAFAADWRERCGEMDELVDVLGGLGDLGGGKWNLLHGLLKSSDWQQVVRIRRLIEQLPGLARLIRGLGRARATDEPDSTDPAMAQQMQQSTATRYEVRSTRVPELPGETRGVHRSARVARMLPAEAMLLAHPKLRLIWHARHAERTLLTYEDDDRVREPVPCTVPVWQPAPRPLRGKRLALGPMLVCVDTSGSMQGGAEAVAKAVVLEAVRTAHAQQRACHVFAFSGPGEVIDMTLPVDPDGVERLTRFIGQSFGGGTDIGAPLERALARLDEHDWQLADLLIASDGDFGATPAVADAVEIAKEQRGLRVQGILIGDRETIGLLELADDVFWVRDWRRYGREAAVNADADGNSPVHTKSLTAEYFPGALRSRQQRATVADAAQAGRELLRGERKR